LPIPRITVGVPVYKGADLIANCLDCLQRQTFGNFEVIISVDGGDTETAAACRPFLVDPRFRMVLHPERLDWVGNFNWLLQQDLQEFFCYRQHDDTTAPKFFEVLLQAAEKEPKAAAIYCDCKYTGGLQHVDFAPSIKGEPLGRIIQYIGRMGAPSAAPVRGLIRRDAIREGGLVRSNPEVFVWLTKLLRWGNFKRVAEPLYYRLDHPRSLTRDFRNWPEDRKRAASTTIFTGLLEAAMPLCRTPEERLLTQQIILDHTVAFWPTNEPNSSERIIADCLARLKFEGNMHLLSHEELQLILRELKCRPDFKVLAQSLVRRVIYRIHKRSRPARVIYPRSKMRRVIYQIRGQFEDLKYKIRSGPSAG
jgi:glycosyltransferase involved in cell wall biosynthesis